MLSDIELETSRLVFEVEKELMLMQLREMLEKTMIIENILRTTNESQQHDFYKPCQDFPCPPKKKTRFQ